MNKTTAARLVFLLIALSGGARADMMSDSPVKFPDHGALPAKCPPDRPSKNHERPEEGHFIFGTPERSLAQIAKIQSEMPIGQFSTAPRDWTYLEHTLRILTEGGELHLLAIGDSIVNDTMRSAWVAKLQEAYPKAKLRATVYVRGGGGCQHYKEEDRIAKHVVPRKPNLVLIGGISQRDTESIREVIRQLRVALPEVEILLVTGVFGRADPRDPEALAKAPCSGTGAYGKSLKKLAAEQQCAYLDMTTPWAQYIRSANVHPHLFYRDVVHANEQGEQILSKILMAFWRPEPNEAKLPKRLKRADSFLGIHFDFHAGPDCTEVGKSTTRAMVDNVIDQVRPDYVQIDCKGHRGLSSYPTKVGNQAPGFVGDPLRVWRQVTAERGVSLYMHYSGVWDSEAVRQHPDWAAVNADGKTNDRVTSFFSPYADRLLIPQLRELAGDYGVDGAWVDGECWASVADYGEPALKAFRDATGIQAVPRGPSEPHWFEFLQFHRELFRRYMRHYIAEVKKTHPDFQICSNWAFTDHMPEPVCAPVDFLSGDYSPEDSVNSARLSGRYLARQGKPWDLMAWSFTRKPDANGSNQKTAVQLKREAAMVVALGGGFQAYFPQRRDGSVREERLPVMAEVAEFCRARQAICHRAEAVPQVALLYSTAAHYRNINGLFNRDLARLSGVLQALLESQQSVEVLGEHHLAGRMEEYPLIVVPEWEYLEPKFKNDLVTYVKSGGNLLLIGPRTAALLGSELGATLQGEPSSNGPVFLAHDGTTATTKGVEQAVRLGPQAKAFGRLHRTSDVSSPSEPAASIAKLGRGKVAATYFTCGRDYCRTQNGVVRRFLNDLVRQLVPEPMVEVRGSSDVDVSVARNHGKLLVNLVNTAGPHQQQLIIETIPPVGPLAVTIRQAVRPVRVTLQPSGKPLAFDCGDGKLQLVVPEVLIHEVLAIETE